MRFRGGTDRSRVERVFPGHHAQRDRGVRHVAGDGSGIVQQPVEGRDPAMLTSPRVGNTPTTELVADGMRMELPVSVRCRAPRKFDVTAVTVPPEEPPGLKRTS